MRISLRQVYGGDTQASNVEEALQSLRARWKQDEVVRSLMMEAARSHDNDIYFVDGRDFPLHLRAAFRLAVDRLRQRLGKNAPSPSTTTVKVVETKEEGKPKSQQSQPSKAPSKALKPLFYWDSPEGVSYPVYPGDLPPEGKYWGYEDTRVSWARAEVEEFLSKGKVEEGMSLLDEAVEGDQNPHFRREVVQHHEEGILRSIGWDGYIGSLPSLVGTLATWERKFTEGVRDIKALVSRKGDKVEVVAVRSPAGGWEVNPSRLKDKGLREAIVALGRLEFLIAEAEEAEAEAEDEDEKASTWSAYKARKLLEKVLPYLLPRHGRSLSFYLEVVGTLRKTAYRLNQMGRVVRRRSVAYYGPHGELLLRLPAYAK